MFCPGTISTRHGSARIRTHNPWVERPIRYHSATSLHCSGVYCKRGTTTWVICYGRRCMRIMIVYVTLIHLCRYTISVPNKNIASRCMHRYNYDPPQAYSRRTVPIGIVMYTHLQLHHTAWSNIRTKPSTSSPNPTPADCRRLHSSL